MTIQPPVFGKRNAAYAPFQGGAPLPAQAPSTDGDYAAFLTATRAEFAKLDGDPPRVVPRSFVAAFLAGIIVGCCLVGLDIAGVKGAAASGKAMIDLSALLGEAPAAGGGLSPSVILLGVLGGGRAAATSLLIGRELLARLGLTSHAAYIAGCAAAALAFAGAMSFVTGLPPSHGWLIDGLAGGGAGLFYRIFAGCRPA